MTAPTTLSTNIGTPVDHPFTVTNTFTTTDIVNFTTTGTSANWTAALLTSGGAALPDTDGDGRPDTGVMTAGGTASFILRVTPNAGAIGADVTTIDGVSFMDSRVDPASNTTVTLAKTTWLRPLIAKAFSPTSIAPGGVSTITFTLTNRNTTALTGLAFTDAYPAGLVNATPLAVGGTCAGVTTTAAASGGTFNVTGGTVPAGSPGTCTITVAVTTPTDGTYSNTTSGAGGTMAGTVIAAGPPSNTAVLTVGNPAPSLTVVKALQTTSDPFNGAVNPKSIPGALMTYTVTVTNTGPGAADPNTVFVLDAIPANTDLFVGDLSAPGSGPVLFVDGAPSSALTCTFTSLASPTDDVSFSNDGGASFGYTPVPNANGVDPAVTHIRINPKGTLPGNGGGNPSFQVRFRVRVE